MPAAIIIAQQMISPAAGVIRDLMVPVVLLVFVIMDIYWEIPPTVSNMVNLTLKFIPILGRIGTGVLMLSGGTILTRLGDSKRVASKTIVGNLWSLKVNK